MRTLSKPIGTILVLLSIFLFSQPAEAKYGGGSGTAEDPYQIATAADLIALGDSPADCDKHFILTADIDLAGHVFDKAVIAPDTDPNDMFSQFQGTSFTGVFDGNDHTISHLTITGADYLGLFGRLASGAEVKDLGVLDVNVTSWGGPVGSLVGYNSGSITNCCSTGRVSSPLDAGGLVGRNGGVVTQCYSSGSVSGAYEAGGLVGWNDRGSVTDCYSTGAVSGIEYVGGLVGTNGGTLTLCYSTGAVSGRREYVGGLVGNSWSGTVFHSFWDIETSGQATSAGGTGKTTAQMQMASTFLDAGWDFVDEVESGTHEVWQMPESGGYPVLAAFSGYVPPQLQGAGTPEDPYLISNAVELGAMIHYNPHAHYRLGASMDLSSVHWSTAVIPRFAGTFDGNGLTISNLTVTGGGCLGLFGLLASGAEVRDLGVVDVNITGSGDYVGGLVGYSDRANVAGCYSTGAVSGDDYVGGLVGSNGGTVAQCYSTGAVSGRNWVGGLIGLSEGGAATHCYSSTEVTGEWQVGGLIGRNYSPVTQCYSTGAVTASSSVGGLVGSGSPSRVTGSFWDIQTSGQATSDGGTGKTTAEMQTASTFSEWAICNEGVWAIDDGKDYPRLTWEHKPGQVLDIRLSDFLAGTGTEDDPYLIYTAEDLDMIAKFPCDKNKHFRLMFVEGQGTPESPYLIETADQIDLLNLCPYEQDARFRLGFVTGEGTQDSPYLVCMADELNLIGMCPYERDAHFKLMADIDLSAFDGKDGRPAFNIVGACYSMWFQDGEDDKPFSGVFDGDGYTISNFSYTCTETYNIGLFGYVSGPNSVIKNLKLTWPNIDAGEGGNAGALVGSLTGGTIANCYIDGGSVSGGWQIGGLVGASYQARITGCNSTATISGNGSVGGLVGENGWQGVVTRCSSTGTVTGGWSVGGLAGFNGGTITHCDSGGRVLGDDGVGGLVGTSGCSEDWWWCEEPGTIYDSYSTAGVLGTGSNCGGLVGSNYAGEVARCYASGIVLGVDTVGGLAGWNAGNISSCYSTADVGGGNDVGGLVGLNSGGRLSPEATIANCYSTGIVLGDEYVGGLVGEGDVNDVVASFWAIETSGQKMSAGGTGKTVAEMQMANTFIDAGWDFVGETTIGTEDVWAMCEGVDYPRLAWEFVIGDFDADADTDFADFCILAEHWLAADGSFWCAQGCDLTNDGSVNWKDLMVLAENWLTSLGP